MDSIPSEESIRPYLTFPREELPSPSESDTLFPPGYGRETVPVHRSTQPLLWFCCRCAMRGRLDRLGHSNNTPCPITDCNHHACNWCALAFAMNKDNAICTKGGLYANPKFIDPTHWECLCGEWKLNRITQNSEPGQTPCRSRKGPGKDQGWPGLTLRSVVTNNYGERLGLLDQSTMQTGGPWAKQRAALGNGSLMLITRLRPKQLRTEGLCAKPFGLWAKDMPAPKYPPRPAPPDPKRLKRMSLNDASDVIFAYITGYLKGIPSELQPTSPLKRMRKQENMDNIVLMKPLAIQGYDW